ncbi:Thioredoxin domain-containing protein 9 [Eumeta japonica]|uniref:Thioredoxin domain-containing protein 9 n=1 Tax=Eumeta variegata TaxID=151549 RepID=A0A4C2AGT4_EUMVA|nr:Thioredoxin domain-containing protein 9 [Eumeta japonica]
MANILENQLAGLTQVIEKQLDEQLERFDNLDKDDLKSIREQRIRDEGIKYKKQEWIKNQNGFSIRRAAKWLTSYKIFDCDILIITDSQAAINSLTGVYTTFSLIQQCRASLNEMAKHTNVTLKWLSAYGSDRVNNTAD